MSSASATTPATTPWTGITSLIPIPHASTSIHLQRRFQLRITLAPSSLLLFNYPTPLPLSPVVITIALDVAAEVDHEHHQARRRRRSSHVPVGAVGGGSE